MISNLARELEKIINEGLDKSNIPYVKGNSIRIKNLVIRNSKSGWLVYDIQSNSQVGRYFSKAAALATAKSLTSGLDLKDNIARLDRQLEKNYNDSLFYKNSFKKSKTKSKKEIVLNRLELAVDATQHARHSLDSIIFS